LAGLPAAVWIVGPPVGNECHHLLVCGDRRGRRERWWRFYGQGGAAIVCLPADYRVLHERSEASAGCCRPPWSGS
jgi:hypothetical protein